MDITFSKVVKGVMAHYPVQVKNIQLLSFKEKKAVWSIETNLGELIVKKVPFAEDHITFMVHAIDYLRSNGVYTPSVIKTKSGKGFVKVDEEYLVIFEAVHGRSPEYDFENDLVMILKGMASFHQASKGIESPTGTFPSYLLTKWKEDFKRRYERLVALKEQVLQANNHNEYDKEFLLHIDTFLIDCLTSLFLLDTSTFDQWVVDTTSTKALCHQDYAAGNLAIGTDGNLYVYDMDSLTVDLPIRDIRKILNKVMKKETWDLERMIVMIKAYQEVNPLTKEQYHVLAADLLFPHLFYGQVTKYYDKREDEWSFHKHLSRLQVMINTEISKKQVVQAFLNRLDELIENG